jgi:hypothetical protein
MGDVRLARRGRLARKKTSFDSERLDSSTYAEIEILSQTQ